MRWSRPYIYNATHNCARHMTLAGKTHYNAMKCLIDYCVMTPKRGLVLKPYGDWYGISMDYEFEIMVKWILTMQNAWRQEEAQQGVWCT